MSRGLSHILGSLVAVVAGLGGFALLAAGGQRILQAYLRLDLGSSVAAAGVGLQAAGAVLLVVAVLTAWWTPVGLLVLGALSVVVLGFSAVPLSLFAFSRLLPPGYLALHEMALTGPPQVLGAVMGGTGLAVLLLLRHRRSQLSTPPGHPGAAPMGPPGPTPPGHPGAAPRAASASSGSGGAIVGQIVGVVAAPVLFVLGLLLLLRGLTGAMRSAQVQMAVSLDPLWLLALVGGFVLLVAACLTVRWSPFALILPAVIMLISTALAFVPQLSYPLTVAVPGAGQFLVMGGIATTAVLAACSVVAIAHWSRNGRIRRTAVGPHHPPLS